MIRKLPQSLSALYYVCLIIALVIVTLYIYIQAIHFDFQMQWDDYWVVKNTYTEQGFDPTNLFSVFTDYFHGQYAPLNELYYIILYYFFGYNAAAFHLAGIILHILNILFVYQLCVRLCRLLFEMPVQLSKETALIAAVIFAIHPINIEPVAWIGASKVLIYALFYMLAIIAYLKFIEHRAWRHYFVSIFFFVLSFLGKEQAITFPLLLLLIDIMFYQGRLKIYIIIEKLPFFILSIFFGWMTVRSQGYVSGEIHLNYNVMEKMLIASYTITEYITKVILPVNLSYLYPFPFLPGQTPPAWLYIYPVVYLMIIFCLGKRLWQNRPLFFLAAFFLLHIAIGLHIIGINRYSVTADRYVYISSIGFSLILSINLRLLITILKRKKSVMILLTSIYVSFLAFYTFTHLQAWKNSSVLKNKVRTIIRTRGDFETKRSIFSDK